MKPQIVKYIDQQLNVSDWELINILFPSSSFDQEVVWLISTYVLFVWENAFMWDADVKQEQVFGFLFYKYREYQLVSKHQLRIDVAFS